MSDLPTIEGISVNGQDESPANAPGRSSLTLRVSPYAQGLSRMKAALPRTTIRTDDTSAPSRPLAGLNLHNDDDPTLALLDAWAMVGDVFSFYQERIANECYLRTATEGRSLHELARLVGHQPDPGASASVHVHFTVEDSARDPEHVEVPAGTQLASVPGPGETAQIFETMAPVTASLSLNRLVVIDAFAPDLSVFQDSFGRVMLCLLVDESARGLLSLQSVAVTALFPVTPAAARKAQRAGSAVLVHPLDHLYLAGTFPNLKAGDAVAVVGRDANGNTLVKYDEVTQVTAEPARNRTRVQLSPIPPWMPDVMAPAPSNSSAADGPLPLTDETLEDQILTRVMSHATMLERLDALAWPARDVCASLARMRKSEAVAAAPAPGRSVAAGVFIFREKLGLFGAGSPVRVPVGEAGGANTTGPTTSAPGKAQAAGTDPLEAWKAAVNTFLVDWKSATGEMLSRYTASAVDPYVNRTIWNDAAGSEHRGTLHLERAVRNLLPNSLILLEDGNTSEVNRPGRALLQVEQQSECMFSDFGMTGKVQRLSVSVLQAADALPEFKLRSTLVRVGSEALPLAAFPCDEAALYDTSRLLPSPSGDTASAAGRGAEVSGDVVLLEGLALSVTEGCELVISGELRDAAPLTRTELARVTAVRHVCGRTELTLESPLQHCYTRRTVQILGNVGRATHGQTVNEVLGSGDATRANQRFRLAKTPITRAPTADSPAPRAAVEVRVQGVRWLEVLSLDSQAGDGRCYSLRTDDDGTTWVVFGDGVNGARLPTGRDNVTAVYRSGLGRNGVIRAGTLTGFRHRPGGIKAVTNPLPAAGGEEPQAPNALRSAVSLGSGTLSRVVSLRDHEVFAQAFPGVARAAARLLTEGSRQWVHLTIAGPDGAAITPDSGQFQDLAAGLNGVRSALAPLVIQSAEVRSFEVAARLRLDPNASVDRVFEAARVRLKDKFSFEAMRFGQSVRRSDIIGVLVQVPGVKAVDLDVFCAVDGERGEPEEALSARLASRVALGFGPAQLWVVDANRITLTEMT